MNLKQMNIKLDIGYINKIYSIVFFICIVLSIYYRFVYLTEFGKNDSLIAVKVAYYLFLFLPYCFCLMALSQVVVQIMSRNKSRAWLFVMLLLVTYIHSRFSASFAFDSFEVTTMAIAANGIPFKKIAKIFICTEIVCLLITIISSFSGVIPNIVWSSAERSFMQLGFGHHSPPMNIVFYNLLLLFFLFREKRYYVVEAIAALIVTIVFYKITDGRTAFLTMMLFEFGIIIIMLCRRFILDDEKRKKIVDGVGRFFLVVPTFFSIVSFLCVLVWNYCTRNTDFGGERTNIVHYTLWGNTFTNRFRDCSINLAMNGFKLPWENQILTEWYNELGDKYNWAFGGKYYTGVFDNMYMNMFVTAGVVAFLGILFCMTYLIYRAYKTNDIVMGWMFACISVYFVMETVMNFVYIPFLIIIFSDWELKDNKVEVCEGQS